MKPLLGLKIDVDTWRGTREGVPALVESLQRHQAGATFLFSLGPDHTGRAVKRALRPGFLQKVGRTSVVEHYGIRTLLYGTLLPGPDIGRREAATLRAVAEAGFECGIHCWDHVRWQDGVARADEAWTRREMHKAVTRFTEIFGTRPTTHGAAGWQMNRHAIRHTQQLGLTYASDCRGRHPFLPVYDGELVDCPQLPTTLPTLDELIGVDGVHAGNVAEHLLSLTATPPELAPETMWRDGGTHPWPVIYTLHAELEGMKLRPLFERLLTGWQAQGYDLVAVADIAARLQTSALPRHEIGWGEVTGRSGQLMVQGPAFPC